MVQTTQLPVMFFQLQKPYEKFSTSKLKVVGMDWCNLHSMRLIWHFLRRYSYFLSALIALGGSEFIALSEVRFDREGLTNSHNFVLSFFLSFRGWWTSMETVESRRFNWI